MFFFFSLCIYFITFVLIFILIISYVCKIQHENWKGHWNHIDIGRIYRSAKNALGSKANEIIKELRKKNVTNWNASSRNHTLETIQIMMEDRWKHNNKGEKECEVYRIESNIEQQNRLREKKNTTRTTEKKMKKKRGESTPGE